MTKSLLMLALVTTQLLAGSGGSHYLCLSNDGTFCCVDAGPSSCTCCLPKMDCAEPIVGCSHAGEPGNCQITTHSFSNVSAGIPCGCTHIQISAQTTPFGFRASTTTDTGRYSQIEALMPYDFSDPLAGDGPDSVYRRNSAQIPSPTLHILSNVLLRC